MAENNQKVVLEDDDKEPMSLMIEHRFPWLAFGLIGGILATVLSSRFEAVLEKNIQLAFFIPVVVYLADAMGTQTENVYVRNLTKKKVSFSIYLLKEFFLGNLLGLIFGFFTGLFAYFWFGSLETSITVGYSLFVTMGIAPIVSLVIPTIMWKRHEDPAIGAGPFATVIQDLISLSIYFYIATLIILN